MDTNVDSNATVYATGSFDLQSLNNYQLVGGRLSRIGNESVAKSLSPSGGILAGAGADSEAIAQPNLLTKIGSGSHVRSGDDVTVLSLSFLDVDGEAESVAVGGIAVGAALADGKAQGALTSQIDGEVRAYDRYSNLAMGYHIAYADALAIAVPVGGAGSDAVSKSTTTANATVSGDVASGGDALTLAVMEDSANGNALSVAIIPPFSSPESETNSSLNLAASSGASVVSGGRNTWAPLLDMLVLQSSDGQFTTEYAAQRVDSIEGGVAPR